MSRRVPQLLLPLAAVAAALAVVLSACGSTTTAVRIAPASALPSIFQGTPLDPSKPLPDALLHADFVDSTGHTVHLADFAGKTVVISDTMTLCQESCPIDTATLVNAATQYVAAAKDPANVVFLTITVDPERDTPAQLAAYRKQYVGDATTLPQWHLLTGTPATVAALWKELGVWVQKVKQDDVVHNWRTGQLLTYDINHSDELFFLDQNGAERYILDGMPSLAKGTDRSTVPAKLQKFLSAKGRKNEATMTGWTAADAVKVLDAMA